MSNESARDPMAVNINSGKVSLILFWNAVEHDTQPFMASADEHTGHSLTGGAVVFPGFGVLVAGVGAAVVVVPSGATVVVVPSGAVVVSSGSGAAVVFLATFPSPVGASVGASVGALVGASVGASVGAAVVSVGASVGTCDVVGTAVVFGIVVVVVVSGAVVVGVVGGGSLHALDHPVHAKCSWNLHNVEVSPVTPFLHPSSIELLSTE